MIAAGPALQLQTINLVVGAHGSGKTVLLQHLQTPLETDYPDHQEAWDLIVRADLDELLLKFIRDNIDRLATEPDDCNSSITKELIYITWKAIVCGYNRVCCIDDFGNFNIQIMDALVKYMMQINTVTGCTWVLVTHNNSIIESCTRQYPQNTKLYYLNRTRNETEVEDQYKTTIQVWAKEGKRVETAIRLGDVDFTRLFPIGIPHFSFDLQDLLHPVPWEL